MIVRIFKVNNQKRLWARQLSGPSGIIIESNLTVVSINSEKFTKTGVLNLLNNNIANYSSMYQIPNFVLIECFSNDSSSMIQTTTIKRKSIKHTLFI